MKLQFLEAGEIVSTHGVRGEMKVLPWADGPDFLCDFSRVRISGTEYKVENCRVQKSCNLLKIQGVDTMEAAQAMRGKIVEIFRCDAPADIIFAAELIGIRVFNGDAEIGSLTEVLDYPGNKVYVVKGEKEYMIPAVKAFILDTDVDAGKMQVRLIEGMEISAN
jgi:16S rRNA processing protein RimM